MVTLNNIYLEDNCNDGVLTGRANNDEFFFEHPRGSQYAGDYLKGVFRPDWTLFGRVADANVVNGELQISGDGSDTEVQVYTTSNLTIGSWTWDWTHENSRYVTIRFIANRTTRTDEGSNNDHYRVEAGGSVFGDVQLVKSNSGASTSLINDGASTAFTETHRVTRDIQGSFEWFRDGVSRGTVTDTFLPEPRYFVFEHLGTAVGTDSFDNLEVR